MQSPEMTAAESATREADRLRETGTTERAQATADILDRLAAAHERFAPENR